MSQIGVLGAGSWGTTLADHLARKGHEVRLWAFEPEVVAAINASHVNPVFLPESPLSPSLRAFGDAEEAVAGTDVILSASPSHVVRSVVERVAAAVPAGTIVVSATKGIENDSLALMSEVIAEMAPDWRFAALSGPSFAQEVYAGQPTAVVAAAGDLETARAVQELFSTPRFRVYTNRDVVGVELGGALKNVIAVAAGMLEGLGLGHNPRAALITRGLAEITRLARREGAQVETLMGLAGLGDLVLTCTGSLSRNRYVGEQLGKGIALDEITAGMNEVAEGIKTTQAVKHLADRAGLEMPITNEVNAVLYEGKSVRTAVTELMSRPLREEV